MLHQQYIAQSSSTAVLGGGIFTQQRKCTKGQEPRQSTSSRRDTNRFSLAIRLRLLLHVAKINNGTMVHEYTLITRYYVYVHMYEHTPNTFSSKERKKLPFFQQRATGLASIAVRQFQDIRNRMLWMILVVRLQSYTDTKTTICPFSLREERFFVRIYVSLFIPRPFQPILVMLQLHNQGRFLTTIKTDRFELICILDHLFFRCRFQSNDELKLLLLNLPTPATLTLLGQQLQLLESASTKAQPLQPKQLQFTLVNQLS